MHDESFHNPKDDHLEEHRSILQRLAALEKEVVSLRILQQPQEDICPSCKGAKSFPINYLRGAKGTVKCSTCGGSGKRSSVR